MFKFLGSFLILCSLLLCCSQTWAGVYHCKNAKGEVEFRDSPCQDERQEFLPITYHKTADPRASIIPDKKYGSGSTPSSTAWFGSSLPSDLNKADLNKTDKTKEAKLRKRLEKKRIDSEQKLIKRQIRCEKLEEKIKDIEAQLRTGLKPSRIARLEEQRVHNYEMKRRYCQNVTENGN